MKERRVTVSASAAAHRALSILSACMSSDFGRPVGISNCLNLCLLERLERELGRQGHSRETRKRLEDIADALRDT